MPHRTSKETKNASHLHPAGDPVAPRLHRALGRVAGAQRQRRRRHRSHVPGCRRQGGNPGSRRGRDEQGSDSVSQGVRQAGRRQGHPDVQGHGVPHRLDDEAGHVRGNHDAVRAGQAAARRPGRQLPSRVQRPAGDGHVQRKGRDLHDAPREGRDDHPSVAGPHLRAQLSVHEPDGLRHSNQDRHGSEGTAAAVRSRDEVAILPRHRGAGRHPRQAVRTVDRRLGPGQSLSSAGDGGHDLLARAGTGGAARHHSPAGTDRTRRRLRTRPPTRQA